MTSRPARPRTLLDFINRPILKGVAPAGNLKRAFTGKSGQNRKKNFGRVMYASETIQNCKNPTGHIDTLSLSFHSFLFLPHCLPVKPNLKSGSKATYPPVECQLELRILQKLSSILWLLFHDFPTPGLQESQWTLTALRLYW